MTRRIATAVVVAIATLVCGCGAWRAVTAPDDPPGQGIPASAETCTPAKYAERHRDCGFVPASRAPTTANRPTP